MRKLSTGEPYAGKPLVRFGGRGEPVAYSDPYQRRFSKILIPIAGITSRSYTPAQYATLLRPTKVSCGFRDERGVSALLNVVWF
jgi:hypothetical protein